MPAALNDPRLPDLFWRKVEVADDGCWNWSAHRDKDGYGVWRHPGRHELGRRAHRISYSVLVEEIPKGLQIDHRCRNRACVNPGHLEPVTHRVNVDRGENYVAANRAKTHCPQGHELAGDNLVLKKQRGGVARTRGVRRNGVDRDSKGL